MRPWAYGLSIVAVAALVSVALASENVAPTQRAPDEQKAQCGDAQRHDRGAANDLPRSRPADCPDAAVS